MLGFNYLLGGGGGSGIVVVRYKIAELGGTAKATGGSISFYNSKTIHTFTSSGTFTIPTSFNETIEYVIGAGGGGAVDPQNILVVAVVPVAYRKGTGQPLHQVLHSSSCHYWWWWWWT